MNRYISLILPALHIHWVSWVCFMKMKVKSLSCVQLFATPWTVAYQALPSMEFSRQEYWSGLPFPSPGDLSNPGIESGSPALQEDSLRAEPPGKPKNTGVGSLSLLHWIFLTQESNQDLLHCRRILYQLATREAQNVRFIYLLAALGLHCSAGFSLVVVCGLLVATSLVAEHGL